MSKEVRMEIYKILDRECGTCNRKNTLGLDAYDFENYCLKECPVGAQLQALGEKIGGEKQPEQFKWTPEKEALLIELREQGVTYAKLTQLLGATRGSLHSKYMKLRRKAGAI